MVYRRAGVELFGPTRILMQEKLMPETVRKVAEINLAFWLMKICATTLGETAGDLVSMTLSLGYGLSTVLLMGLFLLSLRSGIWWREAWR